MKLPVYRLFVERKKGFENEARRTLAELVNFVGIKSLEGIRYFNRYDIEGVTEEELTRASAQIFSEPQSDAVYRETFPAKASETVIAIEYLPGQYDQRADSAIQCLALLRNAQAGFPDRGNRAKRAQVVRGKNSGRWIGERQEFDCRFEAPNLCEVTGQNERRV